MIYVTHDQVEAMTMADKIVVLQRRCDRAGGRSRWSSTSAPQQPVRGRLHRFTENELHRGERSHPPSDGAHTVGVRPEHLAVSKSEGKWSGKVGVSEHLGSDTFLYVEVDGLDDPVTVRSSGEIALRHGDTVLPYTRKRTRSTVSTTRA